jgi:hypothetical protein
MMIAAGYEDGNDADTLRRDPLFKLALERLRWDEELCSQGQPRNKPHLCFSPNTIWARGQGASRDCPGC